MCSLLVIFCAVFFSTAKAWYTRPGGEIALEGTPEHEANRYLKKVFERHEVVGNETGKEMLAELMQNLGLGIIHKIPSNDNRRKKRSKLETFADSVLSIPHVHEDAADYGNKTNVTAHCLSASFLLREYGLDQSVTDDGGIGPYQFGLICPALIYMMDTKTCIKYDKEEAAIFSENSAAWGYGFLSVTVISLLSFLGVAIVPMISKSFFNSMLSVLVAGAAGTLCGDALLHLIPHSQAPADDHSKDSVFKNLAVIFGIYLLFVIEGIMKICQHKKHRKNESSPDNSNEKIAGELKYDGEERVRITMDGNGKVELAEKDREVMVKRPNHEMYSHAHGHHHDHGDFEGKSVASMAWMVIAGDGMHNFSDGIAIGAAFSTNIIGGLSTSIAVFCHELPHEFGDFAFLLRAGMSVKQALFYNCCAACLCYLGLIIGILIGSYAAYVTPWIFAITAGMFLYVALVDMLPEIDSGVRRTSTKAAAVTFFLQNVGLIIGFGIMLLISVYEENLEFAK